MPPKSTADGDASIEKLTLQTRVGIDADRWQAIEELACRLVEGNPEMDAEAAFADARNEYIESVPVPYVDGEEKGAEDLACWSESDE